MHLHISISTAENFNRHVADVVSNYSRQKLYQRSLAVAALPSVRAGYVEMIAGQFQSQGQKIS